VKWGVCVLRDLERLIYTSGDRFPPNAYMKGNQETWWLLHLEMHVDTYTRFWATPGGGSPGLSPHKPGEQRDEGGELRES
jgi:hypothetical protein